MSGWDDLDDLLDESVVVEQAVEVEESIVVVEGQTALFADELRTTWQNWGGMPEFVQEDLQPWGELVVKFATREDRQRFAEVIGQPIRSEQYSIWYPQIRIGSYWDKRFRDATAPPRCDHHDPGHHATQDEADHCDPEMVAPGGSDES